MRNIVKLESPHLSNVGCFGCLFDNQTLRMTHFFIALLNYNTTAINRHLTAWEIRCVLVVHHINGQKPVML